MGPGGGDDATGFDYTRTIDEGADGIVEWTDRYTHDAEGRRLREDGTKLWTNVVITAIHDMTGRLDTRRPVDAPR